MATVNFSVPDEVKEAFNAAFKGENKSAVIARLMVEAVKEKKTQARRRKAIDRILARRNLHRPVSDEEIRSIRAELRR